MFVPLSVLTDRTLGEAGAHRFRRTDFIRLGYPVGLDERLTPVGIPEGSEYIRHTFALPVTIEDGGWIGGGAIISQESLSVKVGLSGAGSLSLPKIFRPIVLFLPDDT